jgi:hypothetical protein
MKLKYLGFGFYKDNKTGEWKCRPHKDSIVRLKSKLKELTCRRMPGKVSEKIKRINQVTRGWRDRTGIVFADSDSQYFALFFVEKS